jgi:cysteine dioxygenase
VLVGGPGKGSPVHDHADANCLMKVLKGRLLETRYDFPTDLRTPLKVIKKTPFGVNQVTHMADELVSHRISNPDEKNAAVSLHCKSPTSYCDGVSALRSNESDIFVVYTPPNATKFGCRIYDERTGKSSHVTQSNFFSTFGKRAVE